MKNISLLSCFLCLIMACIKEGPPGPKGPDGLPYTFPPGNITGYIELNDQFGNLIGRGDSVLLRTYNGDSSFSTYTDTSGLFNFRRLPPGNYDISISKPGFDSLHVYVQHAGGDLNKFIGVTTISQHLTTKLLSITIDTSQSFGGLNIDVNITFEWPQPFIADKMFFTAFLDTSSVPRYDSLINIFLSNKTNIDNVKGTARGHVRLNNYLGGPGSSIKVTAVVVPPYYTNRSWFNYTTGSDVPYPYRGDSIKAHITQPQ